MKLNKQSIPAFEKARSELMAAMAIQQVNKDIEKESQEHVLQNHEFKVSRNNRDLSGSELRILTPRRDFLMSEEDFKTYCILVKDEMTKRGLHIPHYNLTADYESLKVLTDAENDFIDICLKMLPAKLYHDLKGIKTGMYDVRKRFIDINLSLDTTTI